MAMELICTNGRQGSRMKFTSPEFCPNREPTDLPMQYGKQPKCEVYKMAGYWPSSFLRIYGL